MAVTAQKASLPLERKRAGFAERIFGPEASRITREIVTNPLSVAGLTLIALFALVAIFAPVLAPPLPNVRSPYEIPHDGFAPIPSPPGTVWQKSVPPLPFWWKTLTGSDQWVHIMGTASGGWDMYYGIVWGTRTAFAVGLVITGLTLLIGVALGALSAYFSGVLDNVVMRITDIFLAFPFLVAALTLAAVLTPKIGKGVIPASIALVAFGWMNYARLVRGDVMAVREREYIMAARVVGVKDGRILVRHILPNAIFPTLVLASLDVGSYVVTFAALSFLGVGTEVGYADWGQLLSFARDWIPTLGTYWYIVAFPGIALVLFTLGWNLVGDALRDILDPRMRGVRG
jgi:peptide/nickel transport system permease protein